MTTFTESCVEEAAPAWLESASRQVALGLVMRPTLSREAIP